ncbi:MAG: Mth938-like domain-containing protein [Pseudomonadota bacterium]
MRTAATPDYVTPGIDAFGDGGFRVAGQRHEGSILIAGASILVWPVTDPKAVTPEAFAAFLQAEEKPDLVIFGAGARLVLPPAPVRDAFLKANIGIETMDTPTACRSYNLLAGEARRAWAALIAV